jgi:hypothetical protein
MISETRSLPLAAGKAFVPESAISPRMAGWFPQSITPHGDREQVLSRGCPSSEHERGRAALPAVRFVELVPAAIVYYVRRAPFVAICFASERAATRR